ncbi:2,3-diaminopropionate biosynthesis protein SbnB (plasmid) [Rhizobium sp. CB3171]|uniref:2,3-diaminopropionate biosynthesis protein SbnB n=1 Tax=Rhizobium sp. CB3171 TaxID=3039157 RepID=UPI0024B258A8|nr:2,3-diaminopropionate biosynthesis protein SbnB [Rhizobium sp. CB3171]WFU04567.1 2,3-diaminopropionate biosynthesis protein SbnB [Rhizobium sp. CB3171]
MMNVQTAIPLFHVVPGMVAKNLLADLRGQTIDIVENTYLTHLRGETINPDSYFLQFPHEPANRIIALPAAIASRKGGQDAVGIKWIASYPDNIKSGIPRASAVLILNDPKTGYPLAVLEGALISAVRTAASAVLGARWLNGQRREVSRLSFVGGGVIARNILETFAADGWQPSGVDVHDLNPASAEAMAAFACQNGFQDVRVVPLREAVAADMVVFATNASTPYVTGNGVFRPGQIVLNISLRDLSPETIAASYNFFDDFEHCLKANTSPHLAEKKYQNRDFITGNLASLIRGEISLSHDKPLIYSPFGMGILDLALGKLLLSMAIETGQAIAIPTFFGETHRW